MNLLCEHAHKIRSLMINPKLQHDGIFVYEQNKLVS